MKHFSESFTIKYLLKLAEFQFGLETNFNLINYIQFLITQHKVLLASESFQDSVTAELSGINYNYLIYRFVSQIKFSFSISKGQE